MTDQKTQSPRYSVVLGKRNYAAKDGMTGATLFNSVEVPAGATAEQEAAIREQAENFLDTLYPGWRKDGAYW